MSFLFFKITTYYKFKFSVVTKTKQTKHIVIDNETFTVQYYLKILIV